MFMLINLYVDLVCILFIQSIYLLYKKTSIHQLNSTDVVITTLSV